MSDHWREVDVRELIVDAIIVEENTTKVNDRGSWRTRNGAACFRATLRGRPEYEGHGATASEAIRELAAVLHAFAELVWRASQDPKK